MPLMTMTGAEINAQYFSPLNYALYLLVIVIIMTCWMLYQWHNKRLKFVKVIIKKMSGGTDVDYAPKTGIGAVSLTKPGSNSTRVWPINRLCTVDLPYPGDGFIPKFLQGTISTVIVDEEDWEPLLNRNEYAENVASPDVISTLTSLVGKLSEAKQEELGKALSGYIEGLSKAPTRKMIASPTVLGNLMNEKVTEAVIAVNKEVMDRIQGLVNQLANVASSTKLYVCTGIIVIVVGVVGYISYSNKASIDSTTKEIQRIENALGIVTVTANVTHVPTPAK